ncbi:22917_t:CDS:1, partial [Entrophospora sp. SA101]
LTMYTTCKNKTEYLLVTEIKSPQYKRKGFLDDRYKLENEMKNTLDKMIDDGIKTRI